MDTPTNTPTETQTNTPTNTATFTATSTASLTATTSPTGTPADADEDEEPATILNINTFNPFGSNFSQSTPTADNAGASQPSAAPSPTPTPTPVSGRLLKMTFSPKVEKPSSNQGTAIPVTAEILPRLLVPILALPLLGIWLSRRRSASFFIFPSKSKSKNARTQRP